jgi:DNA-binding response OmpR family regulator
MGDGDRRVHILLVEDNPADVELLRRAFSAAHLEYRLTVLEDGAEAMAMLKRLDGDGGEPSPDLTILDLNLPKNDGVEVLEAMRASKAFATVPVAVLSSSSSQREQARLERFRIGRYITKPADLDEFLNIGRIVKQLLAEVKTGSQ